MSNRITAPQEFFGFPIGGDKRIARWDRIVGYFEKLGEESDRITVVNLGPSTGGNPFLLAIISSPTNLHDLEALRRNNLRLSDPRGLQESEIEELVRHGKTIVCQSMGLHGDEIGGTQMAIELAYDLLSREDEEARAIRESTVFLMIPCSNPDGQILTADWYARYLGTEYEGCGLPDLYHAYAGHDNNRDAFQANLAESRYMNAVLFRDWIPQLYIDHHQMGSYGPRFCIPPYSEPIHPHADPLVWREVNWFGAHMACRLEEKDKASVITAAGPFPAWGHLGFHRITLYHNIAGMLTESASAKLASPLYIHRHQLQGDGSAGLPGYEPQLNMPRLWTGGWWRLRDIVEQQKIAAWAALELSACHREAILRNACVKARRQIERGAQCTPRAFAVPPEQHDALSACLLIEKLLAQGIEIHAARSSFAAGNAEYGSGTYVIPLAQPKGGLIKTLLGGSRYPDNRWTRGGNGLPLKPKDTATDAMHDFMGVRVDAMQDRFSEDSEKIACPRYPCGCLRGESPFGYLLDCRTNDSYGAVNRLLTDGQRVKRIDREIEMEGMRFPAGSFLCGESERDALRALAEELHLVFHAAPLPIVDAKPIRQLRAGLYRRYRGGNADEGWTRFVLESFHAPYTTIRDEDIRTPGLRDRFDVIIIPSDIPCMITGEGIEEWRRMNNVNSPTPSVPPEYRSGIGREGLRAIGDFVDSGGNLVLLDEACNLAIEELGVGILNVVRDTAAGEFFCPGSTLRALVDTDNPLGYGMPKECLLLFYASPAFAVAPSGANEQCEIIVSYPDGDLLRNGWLIGGEKLRRRAAMVNVRRGKGSIVMIGFRAQHRAQTHGTFKFLFNCLLG